MRLRYAGGYASLIATASKVGSGVSAYTPTFYFYITDYQGNNRGVLNASSCTFDQITHYYPWGSPYADLGKSPDFQPYKFSDKELSTFAGVSRYDFAARTLFPAIPRFDRPDPLSLKYPHISPYAFCANNPINFTDPTGERIISVDDDGVEWEYRKHKDAYGFYNKNNELSKNTFITKVGKALSTLQKGPVGKSLVNGLIDTSKSVNIISSAENSFNAETNVIKWDSDKTEGGLSTIEYYGQSMNTRDTPSFISLGHELGHAYDFLVKGNPDTSLWVRLDKKNTVLKTEIFAGNIENALRREHNIPSRISYVSTNIDEPVMSTKYEFNTYTYYKLRFQLLFNFFF